MYPLKHKLLTLFIISILFLSAFEFTTSSMNLSFLYSSNSDHNLKSNKNTLIRSHRVSTSENANKIASDLLKLIKNDSNRVVDVILYLRNEYCNKIIKNLVNSDGDMTVDQLRSKIYDTQLLLNSPLLNRVSKMVMSLNGTVVSKSIISNSLNVRINGDKLFLLEKMPEISRIELNYQLKTRLDNSVPSITSYLGSDPKYQWNYSKYNGSGVVVAVVDTGIYKNHPNLKGKVIQEKDFTGGSNPNDLDGHGTHVAGIIASNNSLYTGVAPGVNLVNVKSLTEGGVGNSFWVINGIEWALIQNNFSVDIVSMSAGASVEANGTNGFACFVDYIVKYYKVLWINAAGNNGPSSKSLDVPADAYNCIAVGNMNDGNDLNRSTDTLVDASSRGPTWDIPRIKPDICAPGQNIMSCNNVPPPFFVSNSGTSMATPHVSGAAALMWQYYKQNPIPGISEKYFPMLIKAVLLHTAEDRGTKGPDYNYGYGYIDMVSVNKFFSYGHALIDSFQNYGSSVYKYKFTITKNCEFNISLLWYKDATYDVANHMYTGWQDNAITNLDLYIENSNFQTIASSTDLYNNFESVKINCTPGTYYVKIQVKNTALYSSPEEFILVSSAPLEKIPWLDAYTILIIVLIVGSVAAGVILIILYAVSGKKKPPEDNTIEFGAYEYNTEYSQRGI